MFKINQDILHQLHVLAKSGKLVATIDRGPGTNDCFYPVTVATLSTSCFKDQKLIFWAEPDEIWCDPAEEVAATPFEKLTTD